MNSSGVVGATKPSALVFGASGEQGRAVIEGLVERGQYEPVYAFTRTTKDLYLTDGLGATLWTGDVENPDDVLRALSETKASAVFLTTTTELPATSSPEFDTSVSEGSNADAAEAEFQTSVEFFQLLKRAYERDGLPRHVAFSTRDNVQRINLELLEKTGELWIQPLDDGSVVPHYTGKGKAAEYALEFLKDVPQLKLTLLTMPFLYSNFLGFFAPLPSDDPTSSSAAAAGAEGTAAAAESGEKNDANQSNNKSAAATNVCTQWSLTACFGDGTNKIDMMGAADLAHVVRTYFY